MSRTIQALIRTLGSVNYIDVRLLRQSKIQVREQIGDVQELLRSIQQNGLLQPIVVRPKEDYFEVIAGNRRLHACRQLHLSKALCMIKDVSDKEAYEIALTENIQRNTLNPVEEAKAFKNYVEQYGYGGIAELAREIGKSEEYVSHRIHLLSLPPSVLQQVSSRLLASTTADELVWLHNPEHQAMLADVSVRNDLSAKRVRSIVRLVRNKATITDAVDKIVNTDTEAAGYLKGNSKNENIKALTEAILVLKSTLIHLDQILSRDLDRRQIKDTLIAKRFSVPQLLDELIVLRKSFVREVG